jgi:Flp pilus assembly protein TadD
MPTIAEALSLGLEHQQAGRLGQAEAIYRRVLSEHPEHAEALQLLGAVAMQAGRPQEAIASLEQAVALDPGNSLYVGNLGSLYQMAGRIELAQRALERAIQLDPTNAGAYYHLGLVMEDVARLDEAITFYRRAIELEPDNSRARNNLGALLRAQGKRDEALACFEAALAAEPGNPRAHYNRAMLWLSEGRLVEGWQEYEWRLECPEFGIARLPQPAWDGAPLDDKTLLVCAEQGLGDTIQFLRYLPLVRRRCRHVLVEVSPTLVPLCRQSRIEGVIERPPRDAKQAAARPPFDYQLPMASLPRVFQTTLASIPADVPYLAANDDLAAAWREKLSAYPGFKVGIAWQGNPTYRGDSSRSIPLAQFAPVSDVAGVQLFSLQKGAGSEQLHSPRCGVRAVEFPPSFDRDAGPFMDTAAIMKNLDLVITSDTSIAHLAGALAVPVWLALSARVDWRWMVDRNDSPWYPTMRLFRQPKFGDWPSVFREIAGQLGGVVDGPSSSTMKM